MRRPTANREQAVILTLLDSCVRASEFCAFRVGDFDPKSGKLKIRHGAEGGAKGGKGRAVYLGKTARNALWRYLAQREDGEDANASSGGAYSRCNRCWGTAAWTWFVSMPGLHRLMWNRRIAKRAQLITGDYEIKRSIVRQQSPN